MRQEKLPFDLLESLLWTPDEGYFLLERHVARLLRSAEFFGMVVGETAVVESLLSFAQSLTGPSKVRLTVNSEQFSVNSVPLSEGAGQLVEPLRIGLATEPIQSTNVYLYHKTTQRQMYALALASRPDVDDVVLWNERGEVTEASSSNIVVEMGGMLWTPPVSSGLLAGTFREEMLANGNLREKVIMKEELLLTDAIFLINAVRQRRTAQFDRGGNG
jgi:para-aminobenzoate synthetase/4-amino-4-deoxychorismate lyase